MATAAAEVVAAQQRLAVAVETAKQQRRAELQAQADEISQLVTEVLQPRHDRAQKAALGYQDRRLIRVPQLARCKAAIAELTSPVDPLRFLSAEQRDAREGELKAWQKLQSQLLAEAKDEAWREADAWREYVQLHHEIRRLTFSIRNLTEIAAGEPSGLSTVADFIGSTQG